MASKNIQHDKGSCSPCWVIISADNIFIYFSYFTHKIGFNICKLSSKFQSLFSGKNNNKRAMMALDRSPEPYCTNEMVGNIRWSGRFEQFW